MAGRPKGIPKTGGRQKGSKNKAPAELRAEIAASGETPLDYMLRVMRDKEVDAPRRDEMAKASAPYVHAKLAAIEHTGKDGEALIPQATSDLSAALLSVLSGVKGVKPEE